MRLLLIAAAGLALVSCNKASQPTSNETSAAASAEAGGKGVDRTHKGNAIPDLKILDAMGHETQVRYLSDGRPMLVNLWASWCAPCVKELPTLQKLRDQRGGKLIVLPIDQDDAPQKSVEAFLDKHDLDFVAYQDPHMKVAGALGAEVLPTSILFDANGKEVWRYVGDQDWTSPAAAKLLAEGGAGKGS